MSIINKDTLIRKITEQKNPPPSEWGNLGGLISEIDAKNYRLFLEKESFVDFYVFFKDSSYGEYLQPGMLLFFFIWDNKLPAITAYAEIESCENLSSDEAWRDGDEKHSTWDSHEPFERYFGPRIVRIQFQSIVCLSLDEPRSPGIFYIVDKVFGVCNDSQLQSPEVKELVEAVYSPEDMGNIYVTKHQADTLREYLDPISIILTPGMTFSASLTSTQGSEDEGHHRAVDKEAIAHRITECTKWISEYQETIKKDVDRMKRLEEDRLDNVHQEILYENLGKQIDRLTGTITKKEQKIAELENEIRDFKLKLKEL